jgi:hypothetical protein
MFQKYIIVRGKPILFPTEILHADILGGLVKVDSAGFFAVLNQYGEPVIVCFGESVSLAVGSRPEIDAKIILEFLHLKNKK